MSNTKASPSGLEITAHTLGVIFTGGFWLIVLIVWWLLKAIKN